MPVSLTYKKFSGEHLKQNILYLNPSTAAILGNVSPGSILKVTILSTDYFLEYQPEFRIQTGEYWCSFMSGTEPSIIVNSTDLTPVVAQRITVQWAHRQSMLPYLKFSTKNHFVINNGLLSVRIAGKTESFTVSNIHPQIEEGFCARITEQTIFSAFTETNKESILKLSTSDFIPSFHFLVELVNSLIDANPVSHCLISGSPGSGKTYNIVNASKMSGIKLLAITVANLEDSLTKLDKVFEEALFSKPSIVFIDEIDSLFSNESSMLMINHFSEKLREAKKNQTLVIGATNRPSSLHPSLRSSSYFENEVKITQLSLEERIFILKKMTSKDFNWDRLNPYIVSFSPADLSFLVKEAYLVSADFSIDTLIQIAKTIVPSSLRSESSYVSSTGISFKDIFGYDLVKKELYEIVSGARDVSGVLLYGPPGNSKTMFAKALATEANMPFFSISGSEVSSIYVGETEKRISAIFNLAVENSPSIIFLDEFEVLCPRSTSHAVSKRVLSTVELCIEEAVANKCLIIGATNLASKVSLGMLRPGRLERHIFITLPDVEARKGILMKYLCKSSPDLPFLEIAEALEGFSGAEVTAVANSSLKNALADERYSCEESDIYEALKHIKARVSDESMWNSIY